MKMLEFIGYKSVEIKNESTLLELAQQNSIPIPTSCGGNGTCGVCKVWIENSDLLPTANEIESEMIQDRQFSSHERLSCQVPPVHGLKVQF